MKKVLIIIWIIFILFSCSNPKKLEQTEEISKTGSWNTLNIEWKYSFWKDIEKWSVWDLLIHKKDDNTYYYDLNVNRWAPSYNFWLHQWKLFINWGKWINDSPWCDISFDFFEGVAIIKTFEQDFWCWLWAWVRLDWNYKRIETENPTSLIDTAWKTILFKDLYY